MKSFTRRYLVLLALLSVTLFTAPSIYASCMFQVVSGDTGENIGFCSCGSSAGPYCMTYGGTDISDQFPLELGCDIMCPGVPYQSKSITTPSAPLMFKYPRSYELARVSTKELRHMRQKESASPLNTLTIYQLSLKKQNRRFKNDDHVFCHFGLKSPQDPAQISGYDLKLNRVYRGRVSGGIMIRNLLPNARSLTKPIVAISFVVIFTVQNGLSQVPNVAPLSDKQSLLLIDLQNLAVQATNLTSGLARARANVEIADPLWTLDEKRAKELLKEAYTLTFPDPVPNTSPASNSASSVSKKSSLFPTPLELARRDLRNRVLQVASRDRAFASSLIKLQKDNMDPSGAHIDNATLARQAFGENDIEAGSKYLIDALHADPTEAMAGMIIKELAKKDRAAADKLIMEYLGILRGGPMLPPDDLARVYLVLVQLIFPNLIPGQEMPPPSPEVVRDYLLYVVDSLSALEQVSPGSVRRFRTVLLYA